MQYASPLFLAWSDCVINVSVAIALHFVLNQRLQCAAKGGEYGSPREFIACIEQVAYGGGGVAMHRDSYTYLFFIANAVEHSTLCTIGVA